MENLQEYLKSRLSDFYQKYNVKAHLNAYTDREIKRQWKRDSQNIQQEWQNIKSLSDVERALNWFIGTVEQYENIRGIFSDAYDMDLTLYRATNAIQKMAQCYDFEKFDFNKCDKNGIDELFEKLYKGLDKMTNVNMRRAMQD